MKRKAVISILLFVSIIIVALIVSQVAIRKPISPLSPLVVELQHKFYLPNVAVNYDSPGYSPKKGLAAACTEPVAPGRSEWDALKVGASWLYNWSVNPPIISPNIESIPMIWDEHYIHGPIGGNSSYLMGFNEPDYPGQAELTPEEAAPLWREIEALYPDKKLVSPAPSQLDIEWLVRFRVVYRNLYGENPRLDVLAAHCYESFSYCQSHLLWYENMARQWNIPEVWVTEFNSVRRPASEMQQLVEWMESEPEITRYAFFTNSTPNTYNCFPHITTLFDVEGNLNQVGLWYKQIEGIIK